MGVEVMFYCSTPWIHQLVDPLQGISSTREGKSTLSTAREYFFLLWFLKTYLSDLVVVVVQALRLNLGGIGGTRLELTLRSQLYFVKLSHRSTAESEHTYNKSYHFIWHIRHGIPWCGEELV
jgi:hypothetical protein